MANLTAAHDRQGRSVPVRLGEAKYYERVAAVGTDSTPITLNHAEGMVLTPFGTDAVFYRITQNPDYAGVKQIISLPILGEVLQGGILTGTASGRDLNGGTAIVINGTISGARQVETLVPSAGPATGTPAAIDFYVAGAFGTTLTYSVPSAAGDDGAVLASSFYAVTGGVIEDGGVRLFEVADPGTLGSLVMTAYRAAANDTTLYLGYEDQDTFIDGTSTTTTNGAAPHNTGEVALVMGTALFSEATIGSFFTFAIAGTTITATARAEATDDTGLTFELANKTTIGITENTSETDTPGEAPGDGGWFTLPDNVSAEISPPRGCVAGTAFTTIYAKADSATKLSVTYWGRPTMDAAGHVIGSAVFEK